MATVGVKGLAHCASDTAVSGDQSMHTYSWTLLSSDELNSE